MQIVNRPRKEGPSKNMMLLSHEGGSFEECDAAKPRKNVMQLTQLLNAQNKVHIKRESVLQLNCEVRVLGGGLKTGCQSTFRPRGKTGTEPLTPDKVDGNNLLALTAATPLEEKPCMVAGKEPPPRTRVISDDVLG